MDQVNLTLFVITHCELCLDLLPSSLHQKLLQKSNYFNFAQHLLWILSRITDYPLHESMSLVYNALHKTSVLDTGNHLFCPKELVCFILVIRSFETRNVSLFTFATGTLGSSFEINHENNVNILFGMVDLSRPYFLHDHFYFSNFVAFVFVFLTT